MDASHPAPQEQPESADETQDENSTDAIESNEANVQEPPVVNDPVAIKLARSQNRSILSHVQSALSTPSSYTLSRE